MNRKGKGVGKGQKNTANGDKRLRSVKGKIQLLLKNPALEAKRKRAVVEATKRRHILRRQNREELAELFRTTEIKPPAKSADKLLQHRYEHMLETWIDLQGAMQRNNAPHSLSQIRGRFEMAYNRYHELVLKTKRKEVDLQGRKVASWREEMQNDPRRRERILLYIDKALSDASFILPPELKKIFAPIERGRVKNIRKFDRSKNRGNL